MPRATTPLNDTQIRSAKPTNKEYVLSDTQGLGLRVRPSGTKEWIFSTKNLTRSSEPK